VFKRDIYNRDAAVLAGLNEPFRFRDAPILEEQARRQPGASAGLSSVRPVK
jgi:hypothetical protein